jgi:cyanate lyase
METTRNTKVHQILQKAFLAKRKMNPSYSQRALARDLGTSAVFVTNILTGKKSIPAARFKRIFKVLDMDITLQTQFVRASILAALPSTELKNVAQLSLNKDLTLEKYTRESSNR